MNLIIFAKLSLFVIITFQLYFVSNEIVKPHKNILVIVFPGARSHNFVMKELFDYVISQDEAIYDFHILIHNWDLDTWDNKYKLYGYGDKKAFNEIFNVAIQQVQSDPVWGYKNFNNAMIFIFEEFMKSGHFETFKKMKFDLMIGDVPNFISKMLYSQLNVTNHMFLSPPCLPNLFYEDFEINPSYLPAIGTTHNHIMTFFERFVNSLYINGASLMFKIFMREQVKVSRKYGLDLTNDVFIHDSLFITQCPLGLTYNFAKPPNYIRINAVLPKPAKPINNEGLDNFLNKYKTNIYMSQGTMWKTLKLGDMMKVFHQYPNYGFILTTKTQVVDDLKFPENVYIVGWINQNDLLGDSRVNLFITHGGVNSVMEGLYHEKTMIVFGATIDQLNTAAYVKEFKYGYTITKKEEINPDNLISAIEKVVNKDNNYTANIKKYSRLMKGNKDSRQEFHYWIRYGLTYGYKHLVVGMYEKHFWEIYNYDVFLVWALIAYLLYRLIKKVLIKLFCSCTKVKRNLSDN